VSERRKTLRDALKTLTMTDEQSTILLLLLTLRLIRDVTFV